MPSLWSAKQAQSSSNTTLTSMKEKLFFVCFLGALSFHLYSQVGLLDYQLRNKLANTHLT